MWKSVSNLYPVAVVCLLVAIYARPFYEKLYVFMIVTSQPAMLTALACLLLLGYWHRRPFQFPPGPRGFPILGVLTKLGKNPHLKMIEWGKQYGVNILAVRMGRHDWVVLNDYDVIKKGYISRYSAFSSKPILAQFARITGQNYGIFNLKYDDIWKVQRKFGATAFRSLGVGRLTMEEKIVEESKFLNEAISEEGETALDIKPHIAKAVTNSICHVVFGRRFDYSDPQFTKLINAVTVGFDSEKTATIMRGLTTSPVLDLIPKYFFGMRKIAKEMKAALGKISEVVNASENTSSDDNSFIKLFNLEQQKNNHNSFNDRQLLTLVREFYVAGTESTTAIIRWALVYLLHYPEAQEKIYAEVQNVLDKGCQVSYCNKEILPYTSAFIQEIYRLRLLGPLNIPHAVSKDSMIDGYFIPKGTPVLTNLWAVQRDPKFFKNPDSFEPERFIDENGEFVKCDRIIPFSVGPRRCLGEQLARMTVFQLLVGMVTKYRFKPDPVTNKLPEINESFRGIVDAAFPFQLVAEQRK